LSLSVRLSQRGSAVQPTYRMVSRRAHRRAAGPGAVAGGALPAPALFGRLLVAPALAQSREYHTTSQSRHGSTVRGTSLPASLVNNSSSATPHRDGCGLTKGVHRGGVAPRSPLIGAEHAPWCSINFETFPLHGAKIPAKLWVAPFLCCAKECPKIF
jgi:hypothetical protein